MSSKFYLLQKGRQTTIILTNMKSKTKAAAKKSKAKAPAKKAVVVAKKETKASKKATPLATKPTKKQSKEAVSLEVSNGDKQKIIESFAQKKGDTGSPEVQVALLSYKIGRLVEHLDLNKKDNHSRRGLLKVVAKRRRILSYLQKVNETRYKGLIDKLGLKK